MDISVAWWLKYKQEQKISKSAFEFVILLYVILRHQHTILSPDPELQPPHQHQEAQREGVWGGGEVPWGEAAPQGLMDQGIQLWHREGTVVWGEEEWISLSFWEQLTWFIGDKKKLLYMIFSIHVILLKKIEDKDKDTWLVIKSWLFQFFSFLQFHWNFLYDFFGCLFLLCKQRLHELLIFSNAFSCLQTSFLSTIYTEPCVISRWLS